MLLSKSFVDWQTLKKPGQRTTILKETECQKVSIRPCCTCSGRKRTLSSLNGRLTCPPYCTSLYWVNATFLYVWKHPHLATDAFPGMKPEDSERPKHHSNYVRDLCKRLSYANKVASWKSNRQGRRHKKRYDLRVRHAWIEPGGRRLVGNVGLKSMTKLAVKSGKEVYVSIPSQTLTLLFSLWRGNMVDVLLESLIKISSCHLWVFLFVLLCLIPLQMMPWFPLTLFQNPMCLLWTKTVQTLLLFLQYILLRNMSYLLEESRNFTRRQSPFIQIVQYVTEGSQCGYHPQNRWPNQLFSVLLAFIVYNTYSYIPFADLVCKLVYMMQKFIHLSYFSMQSYYYFAELTVILFIVCQ